MRHSARSPLTHSTFQSAPAIAGGRCEAAQAGGAGVAVSIRARHCWRAMPQLGDLGGAVGLVSIRARHCWRAMPLPRRISSAAPSFQSAPAIAGGRCVTPAVRMWRTRCFNPRPPLLAGDAPAAPVRALVAHVSIRARHCWRAMRPRFAPASPGGRFQSAPAIAGGRCRAASARHRPARGFNPRPPLLAGDARRRPAGRPGRWCFNPRPPLLAGDAACRRAAHQPGRGFNPRPPLLAGDAYDGLRQIRKRSVSIRARHCWRAMHGDGLAHVPAFRFQSAPAIAGGRCMGPRSSAAVLDVVSIRARHCWRAMRRHACPTRREEGFQSAPAIAGGRCFRPRWPRTRNRCFNPRPPLLAGDAADCQAELAEYLVSIRARHCWRAMPDRRRPGHDSAGFQSAPAIAGGRCCGALGFYFCRLGFNPRPPLLAGDAPPRAAVYACWLVSIRARHCWRAMRQVVNLKPGAILFQSAPAIAGGRCARTARRFRCRYGFNPRPPLLAGDAP